MATASLGRLTLDLLVKLGSYEQGLNRAERQATQSANKMSDAFKGFGDQLRETLGGSQIGSIISDITTRLDGMKGSVLVATAGLADHDRCEHCHTLYALLPVVFAFLLLFPFLRFQKRGIQGFFDGLGARPSFGRGRGFI